jgi:hypothetical protein
MNAVGRDRTAGPGPIPDAPRRGGRALFQRLSGPRSWCRGRHGVAAIGVVHREVPWN